MEEIYRLFFLLPRLQITCSCMQVKEFETKTMHMHLLPFRLVYKMCAVVSFSSPLKIGGFGISLFFRNIGPGGDEMPNSSPKVCNQEHSGITHIREKKERDTAISQKRR